MSFNIKRFHMEHGEIIEMQCVNCNKWKILEDYSLNKRNGVTGRQYACKECNQAYQRERRLNTPPDHVLRVSVPHASWPALVAHAKSLGMRPGTLARNLLLGALPVEGATSAEYVAAFDAPSVDARIAKLVERLQAAGRAEADESAQVVESKGVSDYRYDDENTP